MKFLLRVSTPWWQFRVLPGTKTHYLRFHTPLLWNSQCTLFYKLCKPIWTLMFSTDGPWFSNCVKKNLIVCLSFYLRLVSTCHCQSSGKTCVARFSLATSHTFLSQCFFFLLLSTVSVLVQVQQKYCMKLSKCVELEEDFAYFMYIMYWWCPVFFNSFFKVCISLFYICN